MAYATQTDISNTIGAATLLKIADFNRDGTVDADAVTLALAEASSFADTYLAAYLPITTVPDVLRKHVVSIAVHYLRAPRDNTTEDSRRMFAEALDWLESVASGDAVLPSPGGAAPDTSATAPVLVAEERLFTMSTLRGIL